MKNLIAVVLVALMSVSTVAGPYIEAKNKVKFTEFSDIDFGDSVSHLRVGYKASKMYIEAGKMTDGSSAEAG